MAVYKPVKNILIKPAPCTHGRDLQKLLRGNLLSNLFKVHQNDACLEVIVRIIHAQLIFEVGANCGVIAINLTNSISVTCSAYQVSCDVNIVELCDIGINYQVRVKVDGFIDVRKQRGSKQPIVSFWSKVTMMRKLNITKSSINI